MSIFLDIGEMRIRDKNGIYQLPINVVEGEGGGTADGDMKKVVYDSNNDGIVNGADHATTAGTADNASALNGHPDTYFTSKQYVDDADKVLADKIAEIELAKFPNATIVGFPTIQQGQISNFSTENYLKFPFVVNFQNRPFVIDFKITTGADVINQHNILDSDFGLAFAVRNGRFVLAVSTNGTSWLGEGVGTHSITANTTYRVRISWNGSAFVVAFSTDNWETQLTDITMASSLSPYPKQMYIGVGENNGVIQNVFTGIIDLNYAMLTISDKVVWQGMDDVGLSTRLAIDMSNIDEAGREVVRQLATTALQTIIDVVNNLSQVAKTGRYNDLTGKPTLFSGRYADLTGKPTIPARANNGVLTIQKNGTQVTTFSANQSGNATANIIVPTKVSDLTNDSGFTAVTENTVSGWGFTKNTGTYIKAPTGIPKSDLASGVQSSLEKADTALQSFTETDPTVPSWAKEANKPTYTADEVGARANTWTPSASDIGLGNVGNFKAVSTVASQGLTSTEKSNARTNIGAGTYTKASTGIPKTDLASAVQTSLGKADTALQSFTETDPTVPDWAKARSKPTYTASEVGLGNVGNFKAVSTVASQGLTSTEKSNARANIGAGTSNFSGRYDDLTGKPDLTTKMDKSGGTFTGTATASETARTDRSIFNEETRATNETGELQSVKYFINVI